MRFLVVDDEERALLVQALQSVAGAAALVLVAGAPSVFDVAKAERQRELSRRMLERLGAFAAFPTAAQVQAEGAARRAAAQREGTRAEPAGPPGSSASRDGMPPRVQHDLFSMSPTELYGVDSGRRRWRVECRICRVLVHEATTSPTAVAERHMERPDADLDHDDPESK